MAEFFLELFSEEIPPKLQINARKKLFLDLNNFFQDNNINIKGSKFSISTPNRIIINFSNVSNYLIKKSQEIKGPSVNTNSKALEGFLNSHNIKKSHVKIKPCVSIDDAGENGDPYEAQRCQVCVAVPKASAGYKLVWMW